MKRANKMTIERFSKDEFHRLLSMAGLSKKEFSVKTGMSYSAVKSWTVGDKVPPYWVKSWLENYIAAKNGKMEKIILGYVNWVKEYRKLLESGNADDFHICFRRDNDAVYDGNRYAEITVSGHIMKRGEIAKAFKPLNWWPVKMDEETAKEAELLRRDKDLLELDYEEGKEPKIRTKEYKDLPYYSDDTPDAK